MSNPITRRQYRVLKFLVDLFDELDIDYFIDDGLAAIIYGSKRKLYDIDICIGKKSISKIKKEFNDLARTKYSYKTYSNCKSYIVTLKINGVPIDAYIDKNFYICHKKHKHTECKVLKNPFKDTQVVMFKGIKLRVIHPEDLIIQKAFMNRKTDWFDVKSIMRKTNINKNRLLLLSKKFGVSQEKIMVKK